MPTRHTTSFEFRADVLNEFSDPIVNSLPILLKAQLTLMSSASSEDPADTDHNQSIKGKGNHSSQDLPAFESVQSNTATKKAGGVKRKLELDLDQSQTKSRHCYSCHQKLPKRKHGGLSPSLPTKRLLCTSDAEHYMAKQELSDNDDDFSGSNSELSETLELDLDRTNESLKTKRGRKKGKSSRLANEIREAAVAQLLAAGETLSDLESDSESFVADPASDPAHSPVKKLKPKKKLPTTGATASMGSAVAKEHNDSGGGGGGGSASSSSSTFQQLSSGNNTYHTQNHHKNSNSSSANLSKATLF